LEASGGSVFLNLIHPAKGALIRAAVSTQSLGPVNSIVKRLRTQWRHKMTNSKHLARLLGPTLIALTISESKFVQPHLYDTQIAPVVYLSGTLLFVAGLSIVRVHNCWTRGWPVLVTLTGWFAIFLGLFRMFAAGLYQQQAPQNTTALLAMEIAGLAVGIFLTFKSYGREDM